MRGKSVCGAANSNKIALVKQLLEAGGDPNRRNTHGQTPLFIAAKAKRLEVAGLLLKHEADPSLCCGANQLSPLHEAARLNDCDMIKLLIEHGADRQLGSRSGRTPFDFPHVLVRARRLPCDPLAWV